MAHRHDEAIGDGVAALLATTSLALARHFAAGATLWCWSPGAPEHAQHVAVEFVHPVIMGTRALPAVAVLADDVVTALRPIARPGDVLLVVADAEEPVATVLRRAEVWGLTTIQVGVGPRPLAPPAHHVLWLSDDPAARHDGRLVLGYHVLWELTHVCFEHPGLLAAPAVDDSGCITCSDEGRLAEVVGCEDDDAVVRTAAGVETVSTLMVGPVHPGDLVLVHAGTAITRVDG
ncbi:MAG: HypC/HybG/HupF family hydrogenase formation chaperone [Acidimicrobiales bacterium]